MIPILSRIKRPTGLSSSTIKSRMKSKWSLQSSHYLFGNQVFSRARASIWTGELSACFPPSLVLAVSQLAECWACLPTCPPRRPYNLFCGKIWRASVASPTRCMKIRCLFLENMYVFFLFLKILSDSVILFLITIKNLKGGSDVLKNIKSQIMLPLPYLH